MLRVLYLNPFGVFGGSTKSLAEMFRALPQGEVQGTVIAPPGLATETLQGVGLKVEHVSGMPQWNDTRISHYRGARWLVLGREAAYWPDMVRVLRAIRHRGPFDLIHCNEITAILPAIAAHRLLGIPLVVHVRSLQRGDEGGRVTAWVMGLLRDHASAVIAIDEAVRRTLPADLPVDVIHNGMQVPAELPPSDDSQPFTVGVIGVLHADKGIYELIEAMRLLKDRGMNVRLLVAGENIRAASGLKGAILKGLNFSRDVRSELEEMVQRYGLEERVEFLGFVKDIASVYRRLDALCFASRLDAPGRPVFEAALFGRPAIVAMKDPTDDVVVPDVTGLCIDSPEPSVIADAIASLASDRRRARAMGAEGRRRAVERFESKQTARRTLAVYHRVLSRR